MPNLEPPTQVIGRSGRCLGVRRSLVAVTSAVVWLLLFVPAADAAPRQDPAARRDENLRRRQEIGREVDQLDATDDDLRGALSDLDGQLNAARDDLVAAQQRADELRAVADAAEIERAAAAERVEATAAEVRAVAVDAYVNPVEDGLAAVVSAPTVTDALAAASMLRARAEHRASVLDQQRGALAALEDRRRVALDAETAAESERDQFAQRVAELDVERSRRASLVAEVDRRLDAALAESAALQAQDAKLAADIEARQAALVAASKAPPPALPALKVPPPRAPRGSSGGSGSGPGRAEGAPTGPAPTDPPTTSPPVVVPPPVMPTPQLRTVRGITVAAAIADQVQGLIDAAKAAGLNMSGWGYRDSQAQVALRRAHCGPTDFDIYLRPASQCSPPTARPGQSMHERGLAVDLTCNGTTISARTDPCFVWLEANAPAFGLINLPSEPWHWSTNGN